MVKHDSDLLYIAACRDLKGDVHRVQIGRRNRRPTPILGPEWVTPALHWEVEPKRINADLLEQICINLTPTERRTFLQLLEGRSIPDIARDEGVSHVAIYVRIRGKDGQGGMAAKNPYVGMWWELRQQRTRK
jgi:hypothetical protein